MSGKNGKRGDTGNDGEMGDRGGQVSSNIGAYYIAIEEIQQCFYIFILLVQYFKFRNLESFTFSY